MLPVRPFDIMMAKVLANGAVILLLTALSLKFVVEAALSVQLAGSLPLFLAGWPLSFLHHGARYTPWGPWLN